MKTIILLLTLSFALKTHASDREILWLSACSMHLQANNPYEKLSIDHLLALTSIKDQAAIIELLIRLRDPNVSEVDKTRILSNTNLCRVINDSQREL